MNPPRLVSPIVSLITVAIICTAMTASATTIVSYDAGVPTRAGESGAANPVNQGWTANVGITSRWMANYDSGDGGWRVLDARNEDVHIRQSASYAVVLDSARRRVMDDRGWTLTCVLAADRDAIPLDGESQEGYFAPPHQDQQNGAGVWIECENRYRFGFFLRISPHGELILHDGGKDHRLELPAGEVVFRQFQTIVISYDPYRRNATLRHNGNTYILENANPRTGNNRVFFGVWGGEAQGSAVFNRVVLETDGEHDFDATSIARAGSETTAEAQLDILKYHDDMVRFRAERERLSNDPYRPLYHFSVPGGFVNDPNGLCYWQGRYHLFYQLSINVEGRGDHLWRRQHWGHAYSEDMVHWKDLPIAFGPQLAFACFSGQTLVEDDRVIAMYHGLRYGNMIATADDPLLVDWEQHLNNPVIPIVPTDEDGTPYRIFDPCIWKGDDDNYYSLSGTYKGPGQRGKDGVMVQHLFRSPDLADWEYLGEMVDGEGWLNPGEDGAVPNFWPIGNGKHLLMFFSHQMAGQYLVGDYNDRTHKFTPTSHGRMNYGPMAVGALHAPAATVDPRGRYLGIFNVRENRSAGTFDREAPDSWYGIMSLPRHYTLDDNNELRTSPLSEFEKLRFDPVSVPARQLQSGQDVVLGQISGRAIEIDALIDPGNAASFGFDVMRSTNGEERTRIEVTTTPDADGMRRVEIDASQTELADILRSRPPEAGPFSSPDGDPIRLRIFVDRSIVEVFINDVQCITLRSYPGRIDSNGVAIFAKGGNAELTSLDAWQMRSIWPELERHEGK